MDVRVRTEPRGERCPICHDEDMSDKPIIRCGACQTVVHAECRSAHGSCPTMGCRSSVQAKPSVEKTGPESGVVRLKWTEGPPGCFSAPAPIIELTEAEKLQAAEIQARVARETTLRSQLPLLGAILAVTAVGIFAVWLIVLSILPFFKGRYLAGSASILIAVLAFLAIQLVLKRTRTTKHG